jgi:pSer/pThr/pTyr-binding forkhead associated (FHA) protein
MQILLKPVSHPATGDIVVKDDLFLIGRNEAAFAALAGNPELVKLSRRHARIFRHNGSIYLVDLESGNGTTLNHRELENQPVPLARGDEICFAGKFVYKVDMIDEEEAEAETVHQGHASLYVILEAKGPNLRNDLIVITQFPFLIGRTDPIFSRYKDTFPEEINRISRRHAYLFVRDGKAFIEDLGSTNGTCVSGIRLDDQARELRDGDSLTVGGAAFAFTVHLRTRQDEESADLTVTGMDRLLEDYTADGNPEGTIFIDSPTSFLDIFCAASGGSVKKPEEPEPAADAGQKPDRNAPPRRRGPLARSRAFVGQLRELFSDEQKKPGIRRWIVAGAGLAALAVAAVIHIRGADEREIKLLLTQERYAEAAERANAYLGSHPLDSSMSNLATEGLLKAVVPDWAAKLNDKEFAAADRLLQDAKGKLASFNPEGQGMITSLQFLGDLERFIASRGGPEAPIVIFVHEEPMQALIDRWNANVNDLSRSLARILNYVPAFEPVYSRTLTEMRALLDEGDLYLKALKTLKTEIEGDLDAGRAGEASARLDAFEKKYAKVDGISGLREDLKAYSALQKALEEKNVREILRLRDTLALQTPLFKSGADRLLRKTLPADEILLEYKQAFELWQAGRGEEALAVMKTLETREWAEVAKSETARFQSVLDGYGQLEKARGTEAYSGQVIAFYHELKPAEDGFFVRAVEGDFKVQKDRVMLEMKNWLRAAQQHWDDYLNNHGISATIRVERGVSDAYAAQARRLSLAYEQIGRINRTYGLLQESVPPATAKLHEAIVNEVKRQRQWLNDLNLVLDPSVLQKKLALLPNT